MAIERRLTELIGEAGGRLHTARSRNDQVATDVALYVRATARRSASRLVGELMEALLEQAERHLDWPMPAYTHLQRAQPVYLSHHLLAHFWRLRRDRLRFAFCLDVRGRAPARRRGRWRAPTSTPTATSWPRELGFDGVR